MPPAEVEFDQGTGEWVPKKKHLWMGQFKYAILHASKHGLKPGNIFQCGGVQWYWNPSLGYIEPSDLDAWDASPKVLHNKAKVAMQQWGSILHPSPMVAAAVNEVVADAKGLTDEWLWPAFDLWKANGEQEKDFTWDEVDFCVTKYVLPNGTLTPKALPVPVHYDWMQDPGLVLTEANNTVHESYQAWKASQQMFTNNYTITVNSGLVGTVNSGLVGSTFTNTTMAPPFPGPSGKFPKWGPATGHFETKLAEALKLRLGPYATDSMVKEVVKDMLPVLHAYWDEVNSALVALKMTAAEQDTTVPSSIPGWAPTEAQKQIALAEALHAEPASTKVGTATALWKASLSPYLKKQYTQRINFGVACGALPHGTGLETPYIDLWVLAVKKHTKKGEPPMAEDYLAATKEWQQALEGVTA